MAALFAFTCLFWFSVVSGGSKDFVLNYDAETQQVHFQCPSSKSRELYLRLSRRPKSGGNATNLAVYLTADRAGRAESTHERVTVPEGPADFLNATLRDVTCHDAEFDYECSSVNRPPSKHHQRQFTFKGRESQPAITQTPLKSRYQAGELLSLKCTAILGSQDNVLVWEAGFTGEEGAFDPVTDDEETSSAPIEAASKEEPEMLLDCTVRSHLAVTYRVKAEDDGKVFQCRLQGSQRKTRIVIAVTSDKDKCATGQQDDSKTSPTSAMTEIRGPRVGQVIAEEREVDADDNRGALSTSHLLIVIVGILLAMAIVAVFSVVVLRQWKKKQMQPLVVVETPTSSESGYVYHDRRLPNLPELNTGTTSTSTTAAVTSGGLAWGTSPRAAPIAGDTIPKWLAESHHPHLESSLNSRNTTTTNNYNSKSFQDLANTSVYVSMSAVDKCGLGDPAILSLPETDLDSGELGRDRSESLYSNIGDGLKEKNPKAAAAAAAAASSACIEQLKAGDAPQAHLHPDDDDDKSVFVPSFVGSI